MAMLIGVQKWGNALGPGYSEIFEQGTLIHTGDSGIKGRGEGRGGFAAGGKGASWVLVGALGGLLSRKVTTIPWSFVTDFHLDEENQCISLGYQSNGRRGRVTFSSDLDRHAYPGMGRSGPRHQIERLARKYLAREGWDHTGGESHWQRPE